MKKLLNEIARRIAMWKLYGKNKTLYKFEGKDYGGFRITFKTHYVDIVSESRNFNLRLASYTHPYLYLLEAAKQGNRNNIYGYCLMLFNTAVLVTTDQRLVDDIRVALVDYNARMDNEAKKQPEPTDFDNELAIHEVKENMERGNMTRQQRRKAEREKQKMLKEGVNL